MVPAHCLHNPEKRDPQAPLARTLLELVAAKAHRGQDNRATAERSVDKANDGLLQLHLKKSRPE
jgi:hypothetical protein